MNDSMKKTVSSNNSKFTEDWIPVKAIENGMIILDNKMRVSGVKIRPRNIFILDQGTQEAVIIALKNFYNTIDFDFWLLFIEPHKPAYIFPSAFTLTLSILILPLTAELIILCKSLSWNMS